MTRTMRMARPTRQETTMMAMRAASDRPLTVKVGIIESHMQIIIETLRDQRNPKRVEVPKRDL